MSEKCGKKVKVVIYLGYKEATCEFAGKDIREVINLIDDSVRFIPKLEEAIGDFLCKYQDAYDAIAQENNIVEKTNTIKDLIKEEGF